MLRLLSGSGCRDDPEILGHVAHEVVLVGVLVRSRHIALPPAMIVDSLHILGDYSVDSVHKPPGPGGADTPAALPRDRDRHQTRDR